MKWFRRKAKRFYKVGDIAPDSLINKTSNEPLGAFIQVCPETNRILRIWAP